MNKNTFSSYIQQIEELTKKPEEYLSFDKNYIKLVTTLTKNLYDLTKKNEHYKIKASDALEKLVTKYLDEEQVWQQIDLQNNSVCNNLVSEIAFLSAKKDSLKFPLKEYEKQKKVNVSKPNIETKVVEEKVKKKVQRNEGRQKKKSSVVDDKFFKLSEMKKFLEAVEKEEEKNSENTDEEDLEDDFFLESDNNKQLYYNDFFDQPEDEMDDESVEDDDESDEEDDESGEEDDESGERKKLKFMVNENQDEDNVNSVGSKDGDDLEDFIDENSGNLNLGNEDDEYNTPNSDDDTGDESIGDTEKNEFDDDEKNFTQPSTFEARQERLKSRIKNLEEEALKEKPWVLRGEVTANNRPQNSLLEEYVEFDIATRPAPVLTEKSTLKLEDVIIQRIKDTAWDDVVRKIKPVENDIEYKKKLVLDQEKSKLSLAEIYEKEYLKQLESKNEEVINKPEKEPPEHQEIRSMMDTLFSELDALSSFYFTPKLATPEVKIISNLPAINMEEVAPVAASDAALLAPEEVKPKLKGELKGKSERTKTDKNREKRQRKLKQKLKFKQMEAKANLKNGNSDSKDSQKKKVSQKFLQKLTKSSNITQLDETEGGKYVKSSHAFFSKLQNEAKSVIKKNGLDLKKMKSGKKGKSKKLKTR